MKQSLEWHRTSLKNMRANMHKDVLALERIEADLERKRANIVLLASQVTRAEKECRDGFDAERFNIPR